MLLSFLLLCLVSVVWGQSNLDEAWIKENYTKNGKYRVKLLKIKSRVKALIF